MPQVGKGMVVSSLDHYGVFEALRGNFVLALWWESRPTEVNWGLNPSPRHCPADPLSGQAAVGGVPPWAGHPPCCLPGPWPSGLPPRTEPCPALQLCG